MKHKDPRQLNFFGIEEGDVDFKLLRRQEALLAYMLGKAKNPSKYDIMCGHVFYCVQANSGKFTSEEVDKYLGWLRKTSGPRCSELVYVGLLYYTKTRKRTLAGGNAFTLAVVPNVLTHFSSEWIKPYLKTNRYALAEIDKWCHGYKVRRRRYFPKFITPMHEEMLRRNKEEEGKKWTGSR